MTLTVETNGITLRATVPTGVTIAKVDPEGPGIDFTLQLTAAGDKTAIVSGGGAPWRAAEANGAAAMQRFLDQNIAAALRRIGVAT